MKRRRESQRAEGLINEAFIRPCSHLVQVDHLECVVQVEGTARRRLKGATELLPSPAACVPLTLVCAASPYLGLSSERSRLRGRDDDRCFSGGDERPERERARALKPGHKRHCSRDHRPSATAKSQVARPAWDVVDEEAMMKVQKQRVLPRPPHLFSTQRLAPLLTPNSRPTLQQRVSITPCLLLLPHLR